MSNTKGEIPDGFEEIIPEGFEEIDDEPVAEESPGMLDFLMGAPRKGQKQSKLAKGARAVVGPAEAGLTLATSMGAQAMVLPRLVNKLRDGDVPSSRGTFEDAFKEANEEYTYQPRTPVGQYINEEIMAPAINQIGIPLAGVGHTLPPVTNTLKTLRRAPKAVEGREVPGGKVEALRKAMDALPEGFEEVPVNRQLELPLENSVQQVAEMRAKAEGQRDLFGPVNEAEGRIEPNTPREVPPAIENTRQGDMGFYTTPEEIAAKQNEKIPQRDMFLESERLSESDAQNGANLTKQADIEKAYNLRAEEVRKEYEQQIKQDQINERLDKVEEELRAAGYKPKGDGQGPKTRAFRGMSRNGGNQRGSWDPTKVNESLYEKLKQKFQKFTVEVDTKGVDGQSVMIRLKTPDGKTSGFVDFARREDGTLVAENAQVAEGLRGNGAAQRMYLAAREAGFNIAPGRVQTELGNKMVERLQKNGLINKPTEGERFSAGNLNLKPLEGEKLPGQKYTGTANQRGGIHPDLLTFGLSSLIEKFRKTDITSPEPTKAPLLPDSPEVAKARQELEADKKKAAMSRIIGSPLDAYTTRIDTPEKVVALAGSAKDLGPTQAFKARTVSPGMNAVAISSNNPLLRYVRDAVSKVVRQTEKLYRENVTGPDGFGVKLKKLSQEEQNEVVGALQQMDRKKRSASPEELAKAGYNEKQIDFIKHVQKMDEIKLDIWNDVRMSLGLDPVKNRAGHFAGNFSGDYVTKVYNKDKEIVGVIGTYTSWGNKMVQKKVLEKDPTLSFDAKPTRRPLGGSGAQLSKVEGYDSILSLLAKDDPRFAKVREVIDAAIKERGDSLYGASLHAEAKKGIWGNEGNKFWEDRNTNTKEALKAFVQYWEEGIASHLNLPTEVKIKELMDNPALDHMPRAKEYVNDYINNFTGRSLGTTGDWLNKALDTPGRLIGVGSSLPRAAMTSFNKKASQMTMGFVNIPFMLTQYLQVGQMGMPEMMKIRDTLGLSPMEASTAFTKSISDGIKLATENYTGKKANVDALTREAYQYAQENGLLTFSEFSNSRNIFQGKITKGFDKIADDLPVIGRTDTEATTRPAVFLTAVNMLKDSGMEKADIFDTAYNLTQHSMINYHVAEKPIMYGKMGVLGQSAGALQTFKHAYLGQLGTFAKEAAQGKPGPLLAALVVLGAYSGIKGVPFYQELDEMVKSITDNFFHKRQGINDILLNNTPEWLNSGALSTSTGVNMQSRLSAADVMPPIEKGVGQAVGEFASPFGSYGVRTGKAVMDLATNRDALAAKNLAVQLAPSGTAKGLVENALKVNEKGQTLNKTGEVDYQRTPFDRGVRTLSGATSLEESLAKEKIYNQLMNQKSRQERQKDITKKAERLIAQDKLTQEALSGLVKEYIKEKGDPQQLVNALVEYSTTRNQTTKQRLEGIPKNSVGSVNKYKNYND